jgi:hypothetical protein
MALDKPRDPPDIASSNMDCHAHRVSAVHSESRRIQVHVHVQAPCLKVAQERPSSAMRNPVSFWGFTDYLGESTPI